MRNITTTFQLFHLSAVLCTACIILYDNMSFSVNYSSKYMFTADTIRLDYIYHSQIIR